MLRTAYRTTAHSLRAAPVPLRLAAPSLTRSIAASAPRFSDLSDGEQLLKDKLEEKLKGAKVEVQDVSGGCGSFYAISIAHESFKGLSTIKQHRVVNELLKDEIKGMHGLQLKTTAA
ncbi:hypothetical protein JCM10213_004032 [Rhodosporidiobolus nylandii]